MSCQKVSVNSSGFDYWYEELRKTGVLKNLEIENNSTSRKIEIFLRVTDPVDFFSQRDNVIMSTLKCYSLYEISVDQLIFIF